MFTPWRPWRLLGIAGFGQLAITEFDCQILVTFLGSGDSQSAGIELPQLIWLVLLHSLPFLLFSRGKHGTQWEPGVLPYDNKVSTHWFGVCVRGVVCREAGVQKFELFLRSNLRSGAVRFPLTKVWG